MKRKHNFAGRSQHRAMRTLSPFVRSHPPTHTTLRQDPVQSRRKSKMKIFLIMTVVVLYAMLPAMNGQSVTGQISGTVIDSTGGAVAGAVVSLAHSGSR